MKRARLYRRGPRLYLHAVSQTVDGRAVMAAPLAFLALGDAETFLGETLRSALASSRTGARDPGEAIKRQLLDAARSRNWTTFMRGTHVVDVEKDDSGARLFAVKKATRRLFVPQGEPILALTAEASAIELGWAVKTAFRCLEPKRRAPKRGTAA